MCMIFIFVFFISCNALSLHLTKKSALLCICWQIYFKKMKFYENFEDFFRK